jgi:hypothetical protein
MRSFLIGALIAAVGIGVTCAADAPYHLVKAIAIGGAGGWDYISVDPDAHRIYVSHATKVVVADVGSGKVVGEIADTPGVHGFAIASDLGLGFTSNGQENTSTVVDLKTLKPLMKVKTGGNPDAILYEPAHHEVYTFNGRGQSATVFEPKSGMVVATIPLMGKPEAAVFDRGASRIYVNIEDKNAIAAIDVTSHRVAATWPLTGCDEPSGLAFDEKNHRLFSVCGNKVMVALDSRSGTRLGQAPIGDRADGAAFDPGSGYVFSSNGEGTLTIAKFNGNRLDVVQTVKTQASARTIALDPVSHDVFLPAATMQPAQPGQRPQPAPDSFKVLVFGPGPAATHA